MEHGPQTSPIEKLLSVKEVAEALNVNEMTVKRLVESGELPCFRFVRRMRFRPSDISTWLTAQATPTYRGPTHDERRLLDAERALHETCRCEHAVQMLLALLGKMGTGLTLVPPIREAATETPEAQKEQAAPVAQEHDLMSTQEVADHLRVSVMTVHRMLSSGRLPSLKITRRHMIRRDDLERFLERCFVTKQ